MHGDINEADVRAAYHKSFVRGAVRLKEFSIGDGIVRLVVHTNHRGGQIGLDEIIKFVRQLGLEDRAVTFWDLQPNAIEFLIDLEPQTPIDRPHHP